MLNKVIFTTDSLQNIHVVTAAAFMSLDWTPHLNSLYWTGLFELRPNRNSHNAVPN